jgi:phthalate 4,5-dioxygenase oxygenase subunit
MLSKEENELLTQVSPGKPMGDLMRRYWLPVLMSSELPKPDCAPMRVRLLGEDLVAFRDTDGKVGLLQANCPHRGAPLVFGRNEERGIRCIYHGWKFNTGGFCTAMPNVPTESDYKDKVRTLAYPCRERNGVIWTYMGPPPEPAELPYMKWNVLPEEHTVITKQYLECNYAQAMEGDFDGSHISFLHAPLTPSIHREPDAHLEDDTEALAEQFAIRSTSTERKRFPLRDPRPTLMALQTDYGLFSTARRGAGPDDYFWRFNVFAMPFYAGVPKEDGRLAQINIWTPIDDHTTMVWRVTYRSESPLTEQERHDEARNRQIHIPPEDYLPGKPDVAGSQWIPRQNRSTNYDLDRDSQSTTSFAGIPHVWAQDRACTEGMGSVMDRTVEHLGPSDVVIIQMRRTLMSAAQALREHGATPPGVDNAPYVVGLSSIVAPRSLTFEEVAQAAEGKMKAPAKS